MTLELCKRGDVYDFISAYTQYQSGQGNPHHGLLKNDKPLLRSMMNQLVNAVSSLHNHAGFTHMDIKLENILISDKGNLKLCDFGFSNFI